MIPFVKLHTRRFHVTSKIFLRKIGPKSSSSDHKQEFPVSSFDTSSNCQNSCPDYLGIESDENVITVNPQKHRLQQSQSVDNREKFYRASFGIVRFDEENTPKYHGQYKKRVNFTFPHSSSNVMKVSNISEISSYRNQIHPDQPLKGSQKISVADKRDIKTNGCTSSEENCHNLNYVDECYFGMSEDQKNMEQTASEELNCLEKDYFKTIVHPKNTSFKQNTSTDMTSNEKNISTFCNANQVEELNYLEKDYFETLINSENLYVKQDSANSSKIDSNSSGKDQSEEFNYLEKDYFETSSTSKNNYMNKSISIHNNNEEKNNSTFQAKNLNNSSKNSDFTSVVDELSFIDKSFYENCSMSDVENSPHCNNLLKSSSYFEENNSVHNPDILNKYTEGNQGDKIKNQNDVTDSIFTDDNIDELNQMQTYEVNIKKLFSDKVEKSNIMSMSDKNIQSSDKNLNMPKDICNDNQLDKPFSVENNFKFSKLVSEEPDANNPLPSAHDFVKKLRQEQKIPSQINISKDKKTNEEKFDSKGFRILKNQVPNLTYFTHDEILTLLKQNIVYSDDDLLILNKPYSLIIHESKTTKEPCLSAYLDDLAKEMDRQSTEPKLFTVHRLDKETTGCLLLARNETMAMHLKALFAQRKVVKKYWIITSGVPDPTEGVIDMPISEGSVGDKKRMVLHPKLPNDIQYKNHSKKGRPAVTTYKVICESGNAALVEVFPKTGVKHQIRVHFGFGLGCPVLGDHKYSHLDKLVPQKLPSDMLQKLCVRQSKVRHIPMHIHAKSVGIANYFSDGRDLFVNIPIPDYFKLNLKRLKFRKQDMIY